MIRSWRAPEGEPAKGLSAAASETCAANRRRVAGGIERGERGDETSVWRPVESRRPPEARQCGTKRQRRQMRVPRGSTPRLSRPMVSDRRVQWLLETEQPADDPRNAVGPVGKKQTQTFTGGNEHAKDEERFYAG